MSIENNIGDNFRMIQFIHILMQFLSFPPGSVRRALISRRKNEYRLIIYLRPMLFAAQTNSINPEAREREREKYRQHIQT
jgi:hypothetical protein